MSPEAQRIAIAEACGIVGPFDDRWIKEYEKEGGDVYGFTGFENGKLVFVRDYINDLNAMHEAEEVLTGLNDWQLCAYVHTLHKMTSSWVFNATAAQRAEAFLRTIGKWEASQ